MVLHRYNKNMRQCIICIKYKNESDFRFYNKHPNKSFFSKKCKACLAKEKQKWVKENWKNVNDSNKAYNKRYAHIIKGNKLTQYWPGSDWKIATENYNKLLVAQNGVCALCKRKERRTHKITGTLWDLAVDHCHQTNKVRGLLCNACNRGLGLLGDKVDTLENVVVYLKKHQLED